MAGDDLPPSRPATEERLLRRFRVVAISVVLAMIVLLASADTLGRLYINADFHSSELIFGTLVGALLALLGIEIVTRLPSARNGK